MNKKHVSRAFKELMSELITRAQVELGNNPPTSMSFLINDDVPRRIITPSEIKEWIENINDEYLYIILEPYLKGN